MSAHICMYCVLWDKMLKQQQQQKQKQQQQRKQKQKQQQQQSNNNINNRNSSNINVNLPVSFESVDRLLPFLLPSIEVPVEGADKLHPSLLNIMLNMVIVVFRSHHIQDSLLPQQQQ